MNKQISNHVFLQFLWRNVAMQIVTYFFCGLFFSQIFTYQDLFSREGLGGYMRPTTDAIVVLGPMLQLFRGILFTIVLYPFRSVFLLTKFGWLKLWMLFLGLSIFGVCGPAPGSFEGMIYTVVPLSTQLLGLPEIIFQTLFFALGLCYWYKHSKRFINIIMGIIVFLIMLMSVVGYVHLSTV